MKKIGIDLRMVNSSGIGTYLKNIVPYIVNHFGHERIVLFGDKDEISKALNFKNIRINIIQFDSKIYSLKEQLDFIKLIPKEIDMFWSPHFNIPMFYKGKLLVTIHDLFHLANPEYMHGLLRKVYVKSIFSRISRKAKKIICVSNFTKDEYKRLVNNGQHNLYTIYNGVDKFWFQESESKRVHRKPYFLYVGNIKPHKNLKKLIEAFVLLKDKVEHNLIIIGKKEGFITGDSDVINQAEILSDRVHFTGFVDDEELKNYVENAEALVFPSLYEGFGLPPLESMACGCSVISSNRASLPEICGDAAIYIDPVNSVEIAEKMLELIKDGNLKIKLKKKGIERARLFSWENCATETIKVMEEVLIK
ncbi:glycosyltransferase family 4 protein [Niallia sp. 03133]|uniref:glycosyltransferase family 4 protein n=1 Tax=Niallia sp. 03133 TaxID=3458060 RepID=UPI0040443FAB